MKTLINTIAILSMFATITGCERVIDIELRDADAAIIIEANISNEAGPYKVSVTRSVSVSEQSEFPGVTGALVILSDDQGNTEQLNGDADGNYYTSSMIGVPGRKYSLTVTIDDKTYTAESTMPDLTITDTVYVAQGMKMSGPFYYIIPQWQDDVSQTNYYRGVVFLRNQRADAQLFDDYNSNGITNLQPVISYSTDYALGDTLEFELQSIDQSAHRYFSGLEQSGNNNIATPANPVSNFSNGALGYFSAFAVDRKTVLIR